MNITLKSGLLIAGFCAAWTLVMEFTGWYKDPVLMNVFFLVILIQIGVLVWGLKQTAAAQSYGGQVKTGTLMSVYAGILLFCWSMLLTSVLFPHYFNDLRLMYTEMLRHQGTPETDIPSKVESLMASQTSFKQALSGLIGTVVTGLVASLIIAVFIRKKS